MTLAEIEAEEARLRGERQKLTEKKHRIMSGRILGCRSCGKWQTVKDTDLIIDLEFRCPGQTGGYFVDAGRHYSCQACGKRILPSVEIEEVPEKLFRSVTRKEL